MKRKAYAEPKSHLSASSWYKTTRGDAGAGTAALEEVPGGGWRAGPGTAPKTLRVPAHPATPTPAAAAQGLVGEQNPGPEQQRRPGMGRPLPTTGTWGKKHKQSGGYLACGSSLSRVGKYLRGT